MRTERHLRALARDASGKTDPLLVERIRVFYARLNAELRDIEAYKKKRGICAHGISCMRRAVHNKDGRRGACAHHLAAAKAGIRLRRWEAYISEYGLLRKEARQKAGKKERPAKKAAA